MAKCGEEKKKLVFIGGGPATLTAVYHLTRNEPDRYDITIYEMSWRLGGKTASGRDGSGRIEEHGLHILFGSYHNVFRTMGDCYEQLRAHRLVDVKEHWLQHLEDAIEPHHYGVIGDDTRLPWQRYDISFPSNHGTPGDAPLPSLIDLVVGGLQLAWMVVVGPASLGYVQRAVSPLIGFRKRWKRGSFRSPIWGRPDATPAERQCLGGSVGSRLLLKLVIGLADDSRLRGKLTLGMLGFGQGFWSWAGRQLGRHRGRMWSAGDFFFAMSIGIIEDRVLRSPTFDQELNKVVGGFDGIDERDFRKWLHDHGASTVTLGSPWIRALYDAAFSYPHGGIHRDHPLAPKEWPPGLDPTGLYENIAAGVAARAILTTVLTYKGSFYNKMTAGMGDVIHTPLYLVLKARGVRFEFFHRLTDMEVIEDAEHAFKIRSLTFDTLPPDSLPAEGYDPLVPVNGLLCWPSAPKLEKLKNAAWPRAREAESCLPSGALRGKLELHESDFDAVVLGIPVSALPYSCPSLLECDEQRGPQDRPRLCDQAREIETVRTVALQLWFKPTLAELGWPRPSPLLSLFYDPLNTWCDMSHLLPQEPWLEGPRPGNISYFCGPLPHDPAFPAADDLLSAALSPARLAAFHHDIDDAAQRAVDQCLRHLSELLPRTNSAQGFDYSQLVDPGNRHGEDRLKAQYWRVNCEPQACCTLALSTKTQHRMQADGTGYENLFVTGDWTNNGLYLACVEGAFQSGIRSARAISRQLGCAPDLYVIIAEELLNLQVTSPQPKKPKGPDKPKTAQAPPVTRLNGHSESEPAPPLGEASIAPPKPAPESRPDSSH